MRNGAMVAVLLLTSRRGGGRALARPEGKAAKVSPSSAAAHR